MPGVQQHLHQPEDAGRRGFYARDFGRAAGNGERQALEEGEIDVYVQRPSLESREAVGDCGEGLTDGPGRGYRGPGLDQIVKLITERLQKQEGGELIVHAHYRVLGVGT